MSLASQRLHELAATLATTPVRLGPFYVADPISSIVQITFCAAAFADYGDSRNKRKF
jgi:hypothetical protein